MCICVCVCVSMSENQDVEVSDVQGGKYVEDYTKKIFMIQIITMVLSFT